MKKIYKDGLIGIAITIGLLLVLEAGLRIFWHVKWPQDPRWWHYNENAGFKYAPGKYDPEKSVIGFAGNVNSLGYRGGEWSVEKPASIYRIVCLGGSVTLGLRSRDPEGGFPSQMEKILNRKYARKDRKFEVLNAGLGSNTSAQMLWRLKNEFLAFHPDMVILADLGGNDQAEINPEIPSSYQSSGFLRKLTRRSYILRTGAGLVFKVILPRMPLSSEELARKKAEFEKFTPEHFCANVREIIRTCKENHVRMVLATVGYKAKTKDIEAHASELGALPYYARDLSLFRILVDKYNQAIVKIGAEEKIPVIDVALWFESMPEGSRYFYDDVHLTDEGYEKLAQKLADEIFMRGRL